MRIVHVELGRHVYGGAEQVLMLLSGLMSHGVSNHLVCAQGTAIIPRAEALGVPVTALPYRGELDLVMTHRLYRAYRELAPSLVHLHSRRGADTLGAIAARLASLPVVLSRRVDTPEPRHLAALKYRLYDRVIVISAAIGQVLRQAGVPADKLVCVPSVIDPAPYLYPCDQAAFRATFALPPTARVVGMAAQFIARKGHRDLLAALPEVLTAHPDTVFILFGQGPLRAEIEQASAAQGLSRQVRLPGFVADLPRWLPCLDLVVHPAHLEGLGVILLQSAAAARAIVATEVGGIPEVVLHEKTGLLVPPAAPPALAHALCTLLADPPRARAMGEAGRQRVMATFTPAAMVAGNLQVYRGLIAHDDIAHDDGESV